MKTLIKSSNEKTPLSQFTSPKRKVSENQLTTIRAKREELKALSAPLKELKECGEIESINEGLVSIYANQGHTTLKTLRQWNNEGLRVKKGEKALLLWGRPTASQNKELKEQQENDTQEKTDVLDFYPICFVFSNLQVHERTA